MSRPQVDCNRIRPHSNAVASHTVATSSAARLAGGVFFIRSKPASHPIIIIIIIIMARPRSSSSHSQSEEEPGVGSQVQVVREQGQQQQHQAVVIGKVTAVAHGWFTVGIPGQAPVRACL